MMKSKVTVVGDGSVGKTCLIWRYMKNHQVNFEKHSASVIEEYKEEALIEGHWYSYELVTIAGHKSCEQLRHIAYIQCDAFVLCFAADDEASKRNVPEWAKDIRKFNEGPIILAATKVDLVSDRTNLMVSTYQLAGEITATSWYVTSAKSGELVQRAIDDAIVSGSSIRKEKKPKKCSLI